MSYIDNQYVKDFCCLLYFIQVINDLCLKNMHHIIRKYQFVPAWLARYALIIAESILGASKLCFRTTFLEGCDEVTHHRGLRC